MNTPLLPRLFQRLQETIHWCVPKVDMYRPKDCLRSQEIQPSKRLFDIAQAASTPHEMVLRQMALVEAVVAARHSLLGQFVPTVHYSSLDSIQGRIVLLDPPSSMYDEVASTESA